MEAKICITQASEICLFPDALHPSALALEEIHFPKKTKAVLCFLFEKVDRERN